MEGGSGAGAMGGAGGTIGIAGSIGTEENGCVNAGGDGVMDIVAKGKRDSSNVTCREMITRRVVGL